MAWTSCGATSIERAIARALVVFVGILRVGLFVPHAQSLKDRRAVLQRALGKVRARVPVSAASVGDQSVWQRATLAFVTVSSQHTLVEQALSKALQIVARVDGAQVVMQEREILSYPDGQSFGPSWPLDSRDSSGDDTEDRDEPDDTE
ncbi:MAG: DUF503 domain-containing protein [Deltaproteobacteria bacterium]|nr:DUF503 domain-containing protein [Deltaproteobacteria bacterium]